MKPLIVAATRFEILESIPLLEEKQIPYLITGVGMTATAYSLGKELAKSTKTSFVINVGIAGAIAKNLQIGDVVNITTDTFYELGAEDDDNFLKIDDLGFGKSTYCTIEPAITCDLNSHEAITVNKVHGNKHSISLINKRYPNVTIESMEGAAVLYVCAEENIPSLQIRAISNYVEKRDKSSWNIDLALKNLNSWLKNFVLKNY